ncbi:MAG TPA: NADH-quinone oxidoreductase subunit I, partial [Desulfurococcaceae archaeon]|nr:NADH-quinone oxidoreductase subunit I [Desulfurococcaceae archaeon]
ACPVKALVMTNYTMEHLITEDKSTTLYTPEMLSVPPKGEYIVTLSRDTWKKPPSPIPKKK